jgi:hypothetical protein
MGLYWRESKKALDLLQRVRQYMLDMGTADPERSYDEDRGLLVEIEAAIADLEKEEKTDDNSITPNH